MKKKNHSKKSLKKSQIPCAGFSPNNIKSQTSMYTVTGFLSLPFIRNET